MAIMQQNQPQQPRDADLEHILGGAVSEGVLTDKQADALKSLPKRAREAALEAVEKEVSATRQSSSLLSTARTYRSLPTKELDSLAAIGDPIEQLSALTAKNVPALNQQAQEADLLAGTLRLSGVVAEDTIDTLLTQPDVGKRLETLRETSAQQRTEMMELLQAEQFVTDTEAITLAKTTDSTFFQNAREYYATGTAINGMLNAEVISEQEAADLGSSDISVRMGLVRKEYNRIQLKQGVVISSIEASLKAGELSEFEAQKILATPDPDDAIQTLSNKSQLYTGMVLPPAPGKKE